MEKNVVRATGYIFILSIVAKVIGFFKSIVQASYFGANASTDAYNMANGIVQNVLYMLTTALAIAFVPLYIQKKTQNGVKAAKSFASDTITVLLFSAIILVLFFELMAPGIMKLAAPAYEGELLSETVRYFRVMVIGYIFALVSALYQNLLNAEKIYGFSAFTSIVNSIILIGLILFTAREIGIWALVFSLPLSYFFQFLLLYKKGREYGGISLRKKKIDPTLKTLLIQALPILISQATVEINQVVDRALLSSMEAGAVTAVSYAAVLYQFVVHIISIPISTVMFTELSVAGAKSNLDYIKDNLKIVYKLIILVSLPVLIVVCFTSTDIVKIVYGRGNFDSMAISNTALGLFGYIFCLIPVIIKSVLTKAYYALNDTRRPMRIGILEVILNITLSIILSKYYGLLGVVLATAIASFIFVVIMMIDFNIVHVKVVFNIGKDYWKIWVSSIISILAFMLIRNIFIVNIYLDFIIKVIILFAIYGTVLLVLRERIVITAIHLFLGRNRK